MNPSPGRSTEQFLRAIRRRAWAEVAIETGLRAAWWASAAVVLGGVSHLVLRAHSGRATVALALVALLGPVVVALLRHRPSLDRAARIADGWFAGAGLMTAARDQLERSSSERAGAADFVIASADERAPVWRARLRSERRLPSSSRSYGPVVVALVGVFLHLLPGASLPRPVEDGSPPAQAAVSTEQRSRAALEPRSGHESATGRSERPRGLPEPGAHRSAAAAPEGLTSAALSLPGADSAGSPGLAGDPTGGTSPGRAAPREAKPAAETLEPLPSEFVQIPSRRATQEQGVGAVELFPTALDELWVESTPAPLRPVEVAGRAELGPELRAYFAAYLSRIREIE